MSAAYITASGITKDIGLSILNNIKGMNEWWMPAATGAVFLLPYLACVGLLHQIPEPTAQDKNDRVARTPMFHKHRLAYLSEYWPGLSLLFSASLCASAYREFRDVFGAEVK